MIMEMIYMKELFIQILISFKYQQHSQKWVLGATSFPVLCSSSSAFRKSKTLILVFFLTDFALNPQLQTLQPTATVSGIGTKLLLMNFRVLGATPFSVLCSSSSAFRKAKTLCQCFSPQIFEFSVTNFAANNNHLRNWNKIAVNEF